MKSNWSNAAKRIMKYQFGLTLALVGSTVIISPRGGISGRKK